MRTLLVCLLLVIATIAFAQLERTTLVNTALSDAGVTVEDFIIGIGTADKNAPSAQKLARERAVKAIFDQLTGKIRNIILASKNRPGGGHQNVAGHYSTVTQEPRVVVELPHIVDIPLTPGNHNIYAVVAVNRQELIDFYAGEAERLRTEIDATLNEPSLAGDPTYTARQYLGTYARYEALKEAEMIMLGATVDLTAEEIFQTLQQYVTQQHDAIYNVDRYFEAQYPVTDIRSVAHVISTQLGIQDPSSADRVQLDPFTYDISEMPSQFSVTLASALERELTVQWATFPPPGLSAPAVHPLGFGRNITARLSGTFWKLGNKITVRATLRDVNTGEFQAAAVVRFNKNLSGINVNRYAPPNYQYVVNTLVADAESQLASDFTTRTADFPVPRAVDSRTETTGINSGNTRYPVEVEHRPNNRHVPPQQYIGSGFTVEVRTDRPDSGNYFYIGERTSIWVRANRPAYYRLGYGFADGRYAILRDNEYIDESQVNQWVKVPGTLVFTEPEGSEYLRVVAQETQLPPIQTYTEGQNRFLSTSQSDIAMRGGVEQARANIIGLRGAIMEEETESPEVSELTLRGAAMLTDSAEAQLTIVTESRH